MTTLNLAREFARHRILQDHFKAVPEDYLIRDDAGGATVRCLCGSLVDLCFGQVASCACARVFVMGSRAYAAPPPLPAEKHDCEAARFTLRDGTVVVADYCEQCMQDL